MLIKRLIEHRVELTGDCPFSFDGKEGELESLWREYSAKMQGRTLDNTYIAFTLPTFLEKVAPLIPMLEKSYQIKYKYLKSLGARKGMEIEAGAWYELRLYHTSHRSNTFMYLSALWDGSEEGTRKFVEILRYILTILVRISHHGPIDPRYFYDD